MKEQSTKESTEPWWDFLVLITVTDLSITLNSPLNLEQVTQLQEGLQWALFPLQNCCSFLCSVGQLELLHSRAFNPGSISTVRHQCCLGQRVAVARVDEQEH